jgi:hypothetical protein
MAQDLNMANVQQENKDMDKFQSHNGFVRTLFHINDKSPISQFNVEKLGFFVFTYSAK